MNILRTFEINGSIETKEDITEGELTDLFLEFCEQNNLKFGGAITETTEEEDDLEYSDEENEDEDRLDLFDE